jgi:hypothetical protein
VKIQNGSCIQDGVENVYIFHQIFSKMIIGQFFFFFLFTLGRNKNFMQYLISCKLENFHMKVDIFQKLSRFYYSTTDE